MAASLVPCFGQDADSRPEKRASEQKVEDPKRVEEPSSEAKPTDVTRTAQTSASQTTNHNFVFPTRKERFNRYVKSTVGPSSLFNAAAAAGVGQWRDNPDEWEQGMSGYGKRFASSFSRNGIQQTVVYGLDSALGLDTGFRKSQHTKFGDRLKDALLDNVTSRTRSGKRVISVPRFAGVYSSAIIASETWYPERYSYKDGLRSGTHGMIMGFGLNLIREFLVNW